MSLRTLLKYLLLFGLCKWNLEVLTELHELSKVNLVHTLLELLKLPILGYMLSGIKTKNLL